MRQQGNAPAGHLYTISGRSGAGERWAYVARSTRVESHNRSAVAYQRTEAG